MTDKMESQKLSHSEEEESDEEEPANMEEALDQFRELWQMELQQQNTTPGGGNRNDNQATSKSRSRSCDEAQAKYLFVQGMHYEQGGHLSEAVKYYRKAIQLVPDIEFRIDMQPFMRKRRVRKASESSLNSQDGSVTDDDDDLSLQFRQILSTQDNICEPEFEQQITHISVLPIEIIMCIFKWVISSEVDLRSLEQLSLVCRGFYICARDEELWRLACLRVFGPAVRRCSVSWRAMYIEKPHLNFTGCYISKSSYVRQGEKGLESWYRPVHLVEYYRYLRFFPNGTVYMMTAPDEPVTIISKLREYNAKMQGLLYGFFRVNGDNVSCRFKRKRAVDNQNNAYRYRRHRQQQIVDNTGEQTFHAEFLLKRSGKRRNANLVWLHFSVHTYYKSSRHEEISDFELKDSTYPPLFFSRVRSYSAVSQDQLK